MRTVTPIKRSSTRDLACAVLLLVAVGSSSPTWAHSEEAPHQHDIAVWQGDSVRGTCGSGSESTGSRRRHGRDHRRYVLPEERYRRSRA